MAPGFFLTYDLELGGAQCYKRGGGCLLYMCVKIEAIILMLCPPLHVCFVALQQRGEPRAYNLLLLVLSLCQVTRHNV